MDWAVIGDWRKIIVEYSGNDDPLRSGHFDPQVMDATIESSNVELTLADTDSYD